MVVGCVPEYVVDPLRMTADGVEEGAEAQTEDGRDKEEQKYQLLSQLNKLNQ